MSTLFKVLVLVIYALALAGLAGLLPPQHALWWPRIALVLFIAHAIELVAVYKILHRYRGPLAMSIVLTLLFGLLHWRPLMRAADKP
jgi:hypothetical protein